MRNFYVRPDAEFVTASANFASLISTSPGDYGLVASQSTAFGLLNTTLQAKYQTAIEPTTRTSVAIAEKDQARAAVRESAIALSKIIYATSTVSDAQLNALGLRPRPVRAPRPVPDTAPVIEVVSVTGRIIKVRVHEAGAATKRGKAPGATSAGIFAFAGPVAPTDPALWSFQGLCTRSMVEIELPLTVAAGTTVWLTAVWYTARGQSSIAGAPISTIIQGGAALPIAA